LTKRLFFDELNILKGNCISRKIGDASFGYERFIDVPRSDLTGRSSVWEILMGMVREMFSGSMPQWVGRLFGFWMV